MSSAVAGSATLGSVAAARGAFAVAGRGDKFDAIREDIRKAIGKGSPASIAVAVSRNGKVIWEEAFGWADRERRVPSTKATRYAIASASKPFTATAVMVLAERGSIGLDEPISRFLGDVRLTAYAGDASAVTIRHLIQHTSGLPRHWRNFYSDENETPPALQETLQRYGILASVPGKRYNYSNLGYALLAQIIEQVSRLPFAEFMRREVFIPLGLRDTTIENAPRLSRPAASFYNADGKALSYYTVDEPGSQRVFSTAYDLIRFGNFHLKKGFRGRKQIISDAAIDQMARESDVKLGDGSDLYCGLGWVGRKKNDSGYYTVGHSGDAPGVTAQLTILPDEGIAVATLANTRFADLIYTVEDGVLDALLPDNKKMRERASTMRQPKEAAALPIDRLVGKWTGEIKTYSGKIPAVMTFQPDGNVLFKLQGQLETLMSKPRIGEGSILAECQGTITTADAMRRPHHLRFRLQQENDLLSGTVHAQSSANAVAKGLPWRDHFALASWIELRRPNL